MTEDEKTIERLLNGRWRDWAPYANMLSIYCSGAARMAILQNNAHLANDLRFIADLAEALDMHEAFFK